MGIFSQLMILVILYKFFSIFKYLVDGIRTLDIKLKVKISLQI